MSKLAPAEVTRYRIERLGHRGEGIAQGPDGPVYVRRALPGELIEGVVEEGRIASPRILEPSADRVAAPCPHARTCGGCVVQHLRDAAVAAWKVDIVRRALDAQGLSAPFRQIVTSRPRSRRRATFASRRTRSGALVGFHAAASEVIVDTPHCHLVTPALSTIRPALAEITRIGASRKDTLALTVTETDQGIDLSCAGGRPLDDAKRGALAGICEQAGIPRLTWNGDPVAQSEPPFVTFDRLAVPLPPGAFLQATAEGESALRNCMAEAVTGARRVVDLFAGCGTFALPLARTAEVHAVEGDAALMTALDAGWRRAHGLKKITTESRDLYRRPLLRDELNRFDAAVIDPPRAGAEAQTVELANSGLTRIGAVSCNPATFARDAKLLHEAGFQLSWVQIVDQFRWSAHVELAALFARPHIAG